MSYPDLVKEYKTKMNNEMSIGTPVAFGNVTILYTPSQLEPLLELMASYFEKRISQEAWRQRFVVEHLAQAFGEPHDTVALLVEGTLADADPPAGITPIPAAECWDRIWHICATAEAVLCSMPKQCRRFAKQGSL